MDNFPTLLNISQVSRITGRSRKTISEAVRCGQIPAVHILSRTLIPRDRLFEVLQINGELTGQGAEGRAPGGV
jgi:hypothetical protein